MVGLTPLSVEDFLSARFSSVVSSGQGMLTSFLAIELTEVFGTTILIDLAILSTCFFRVAAGTLFDRAFSGSVGPDPG